jgi:hypothetical protein
MLCSRMSQEPPVIETTFASMSDYQRCAMVSISSPSRGSLLIDSRDILNGHLSIYTWEYLLHDKYSMCLHMFRKY